MGPPRPMIEVVIIFVLKIPMVITDTINTFNLLSLPGFKILHDGEINPLVTAWLQHQIVRQSE